MEWVDKLIDDIDNILANDKSVKFNTHKNRKRIMGTISGLIKANVNANVPPLEPTTAGPSKQPLRNSQDVITRPNPKESRGFAVMTEGESSKNDDVHKEHRPGSPSFNRDAIKNHNAGMRKW